MVNVVAIGKGLKTTAEIIGAVTTVVGAAGSLQEAIQPVVESEEGKAAAEKGKRALGGILQKAAEAKGSVGAAVGKVADAKSALDEQRQARKEERDLAREIKKARQVVLENASKSVTYKEFAKGRGEDGVAAAALAAGLYAGAGCFVVATYAALDFDRDLTDYLYLYVGKGERLGEAIELACSRDGDPDLYADVKYKQNVHVYAYPCAPADIDGKYEALASLFADEPAEAE